MRIIDAFDDRRVVVISILGLGIMGIYFYLSSYNSLPTSSDIRPLSDPCTQDHISQVKCTSNGSISSGVQGKHMELVNSLIKNGTALEHSGQLQEAIKYYDKALLLQPTNQDLLVKDGDALTKIKNYTGAIKHYVIALAMYPNSSGSTGIIENIGNNLYNLGNYTKAIQYYDKALAIKPDNPDLLINMGNALFHVADYSGAIKYYDKALAIKPKNTSVNITSLMINEVSAKKALLEKSK